MMQFEIKYNSANDVICAFETNFKVKTLKLKNNNIIIEFFFFN